MHCMIKAKLVHCRKPDEITWHIYDSRLVLEMELLCVNFTLMNKSVILFWFPCKIFLTSYLNKYFFCKACSQKCLLKFESKPVVGLKNKKEGDYYPSVLEVCLQCKKLIGDSILKIELTILLRIKSEHYRTTWWHILRASTSVQEVSFFTCNHQVFS